MLLLLLLPTLGSTQERYSRYNFRRQDDALAGQFVDYPADVEQIPGGQDSSPVPVVIKGLQVLPSGSEQQTTKDGQNKPAFSFDNDTTMNLDGPGYALSLLLLGEIIILGMAFFSGLGSSFGRSLPELSFFQVEQPPLAQTLGLDVAETAAQWIAGLARLG